MAIGRSSDGAAPSLRRTSASWLPGASPSRVGRPRTGSRRVARLERRAAALGIAALAAGWLALAIWLGVEGAGNSPWRDGVLYVALQWGAAIAVAVRGIRWREERRIWLALAAGLAAFATGEAIYAQVVVAMDPEPFPSVADPFYLLIYPALYVALFLMIRVHARDLSRSVWWDGLIAALGLAAVTATLVGNSVLGIEGPALVVVVGLAYPVLDILLLQFVVAALIFVGAEGGRRLRLMAAALIIYAVADLNYGLQVASDHYVEGTWLDSLWPLAGLLFVAAAWTPNARLSERKDTPLWLVTGAPIVGAVMAIGVVIAGTLDRAPRPATVIAAAALVVVIGRMAGTVHETRLRLVSDRLAATDDLTRLPNRRAFTMRAQALLDKAAHPAPLALLLADLNGFKEVNDSLGHAAGDTLLEVVAERLQYALRSPHDILARLGGDEFALILPGADAAVARKVCERVRDVLAPPVVIDGVRVRASISIGVALAPDHGDTLSMLLRRADIAMYRAKRDGDGSALYDTGLGDQGGEDRLQRVDRVRRALDAGEIVLHYQPKVDLERGTVTDVEALARWDRPGVGVVGPAEFLPIIEEAGLMGRLNSMVLDRALAQVVAWDRDGCHLDVAVNLPAGAMSDERLPDQVAAALARHRLPGQRLILEITESSLLGDRTTSLRVLHALRETGVRIAIDDFGTGYSSLAYLRELPVDELKLDRTFVAPVLDDARAAQLARFAVELAHSLELRVVAEGVENHGTAQLLRAAGADQAQGFLYSPALAPEALLPWLEEHALAWDAVPAAAGVA